MDLIKLKSDACRDNDIYSHHLHDFPIYLCCCYDYTKNIKLNEYLLYMAMHYLYCSIITKFVLYIHFYEYSEIAILSPFLIYFNTTKGMIRVDNIPLNLMYICSAGIIDDYPQYLVYFRENFIVKSEDISSKYLRYVQIDDIESGETANLIRDFIHLLDLLPDNTGELKRCKDIISNLNKHIPFVLKF
jgi:hypothetical protein